MRSTLAIVIVGHVDHGKSTLVGRLFHDTGSLPHGKAEAIQAMCAKRGMPFEWAFLMDALQAERDQGITIDTSQIWFKTKKRDYVIIDAPGHKEFLKNMVTGAAASQAALLVIDAVEGVREQSRRHGYLLHLLGVPQVAVAVNKMDKAGYGEARFKAIQAECEKYLASIGIAPSAIIPVSAREGDNLVARSAAMPWYKGPTVVEALDAFKAPAPAGGQPLRFPVQDVYKFDDRRIIAGRIEAGTLKAGDEILFSPSNKRVKVRSIEAWAVPSPPAAASAGQSIGITLEEQIFVQRGEVASHAENAPVETDVFRARVFWLGKKSLAEGANLKLRLGPLETRVQVQDIEAAVSTEDLAKSETKIIERNTVGEVVLRTPKIIALDEFSSHPCTGRFVLLDEHEIAGGGIVSMEGYADQRSLITMQGTNISRVEHRISVEERARRNGHYGGVLWFTGLSGAGKSTLALEVERRLHAHGYQVYVLDGDNVRHGLNANLGFSPEDRAENIRRVGEVAALFSRAGMLAITAFISPYRSDRNRARRAAGAGFHEIFIDADIETCERRDPKGLYKKARKGEIKEFTGVSAPYEPPQNPELVVKTGERSIEACVEQILDYVEEHLGSKAVRTKKRAKIPAE
ncbi:MAG TPA: adenylyl-sulfate kinase [Sphingomonadales bacterium]|nr:adenylyl-sulfate kinase [Sphingomonadales bacterium]